MEEYEHKMIRSGEKGEHRVTMLSGKHRSAKTEALANKKDSFANQKCKHGVTNANYCESCSHPKRARLNEGRIPFADKMSRRKD